MSLKTIGKRRAKAIYEEEGNAEEENGIALIAEQKHDLATLGEKTKLPPSVGMERLRRHVADVFRKYAHLIPVHRLMDRGREVGSGAVATYHEVYAVMAFEALSTSPLILTERGLAARLGLSAKVWERWKEQNEELRNAVEEGMIVQAENLSARGIEDRVNVAGLIMAMKNSPHRWRDKVEHDVGENIASLIREAEAHRRPVKWTDIGGYGVAQALPRSGGEVIDVESRGGEAEEKTGEQVSTD